ncbi:replication factor C small subunit / DNA polymerase clamp loader subunit [Synechococcus phage S-N03]|uniref:Sliding-clamp-loader large subunit n=1 Tax=Synechococcus phage S-N03 TaxID=2718943 RepID=A0A6G8R5T5_9CAUD|nr:replication factor C small subunit / DNA polymerase clamp loader subunit [Synechococcus phage S-N03]QIN96744.1 replication factor C small subunit / DNA polymerase clamp loader subunit [Synechococcus phage S-N03]
MTDKKFLWVESYAPQTVADCILPKQIKDAFSGYVEEGEFPNLILAGPAGVGKTSVSRALCNELDVDLLFVNASNNRGIDEVRTTLTTFASSSSLFGKKKVVLLDEADNLTPDAQKAMRAMIEEFQSHCRFILTCNYPHNIIDAIHSRCTVFDFAVNSPKARKELAGLFLKRVAKILKENQVEFDTEVLVKFVVSKAPDWRGTMNAIQGNIKGGKLSDDILGVSAEAVVEFIKHKKWNDVRDWMFENSALHPRQVERELYSALQPHLTNQGKVSAVLAFGEYSHKITAGADPVITLLALATTLMMECEFLP